MAWRVPASMTQADENVSHPHGSQVRDAQRRLAAATRKTLAAVVADVRAGLAETVGVGATQALDERASVVIPLPALPNGLSPEYIALAIDSENVEAWCDERGRVHVAISPWYSTKDVDQVVLSITKVLHVLLGIHATDVLLTNISHAGFWRRLLAAATEIGALQKRLDRK